ncbi:MAG: helix-turn-helix domain-containing protein, partial [Acidobacteria bacterium]|nr:helix-turn-helix domain-containing protein [Acidobacteriota bacterium]
MAAEGWTVTEAAARLGCTRQTFSRVLNGKTGISPAMALALERIRWSNAAFW